MAALAECSEPHDALAVVTCFTIPGVIAGGLFGAVTHKQMRGMLGATLKGALLGAAGATAIGGGLAFALRAGIDAA